MKSILIDTSVIIDFLRSKTRKQETLFYTLTETNYTFSVALITCAELYSRKGVWENKRAEGELARLLSSIEIIPFENDIAKEAGRIRAKYNINLIDAIIGATAIIYTMELVTFNVKDFKPIKELQLFPYR